MPSILPTLSPHGSDSGIGALQGTGAPPSGQGCTFASGMDYGRHRIWREVSHIYSHLEATAPAGFQPVVQVYLAGREQPVEPAVIETHPAEEYPWVKLYTGDEERGYVFVHEGHIQRIEVTFLRRSGVPIGFVVESRDDSISDE